jgi:DNA polymerase I-like protein with 3'-5' exonuclease and polymerase domains
VIRNPSTIDLTPIVAIDLETTGLRAWEEKIDLIALKTQNNRYILEAAAYSKEWLTPMFERIASECTVVINHNIKFDAGFIWKHYGVLLKNIHCTQVSAQICENGKQKLLRKVYPKKSQGPFSLVSTLHRWMGITHANQNDKDLMRDSFIDPKLRDEYKKIPSIRKRQMEYALEDVEHLEALYKLQLEKLEELDLMTIYRLEHKVLPILVKMEIEGCLIDPVGWKELIETFWKPELANISKKLDEEVRKLIAGKNFKYTVERNMGVLAQLDIFGNSSNQSLSLEHELNYGSSEQLLELFAFLKEKAPVDDDGKESLEEGYLSVYLTEHPETKLFNFINLLIEFRGISKMISTYGDKFLKNLDKNNHVHTSYTQTQTETGRLSSKSPNLQNIKSPPKGDETKNVRRFFIAKPGHKFITCDMEGAEVRIAADYSKEPLLLDSIIAGADMHSQLASLSYSIIFNEPVTISKGASSVSFGAKSFGGAKEYVLSELRDTHKSVVFAKFYKGGAKRIYGVLSEYINTHISPRERMEVCKQISVALDSRMPLLSKYLSGIISRAQREGSLRSSIFGRIRFFDPSKVYGEAANFPIQGTNAEALKMALIRLDDYFTKKGWGRVVMNVHDEVICEVPDEFAGSSEFDPITKTQLNLGEASIVVRDIMAESLGYFLKSIKGGATVSVSQFWTKQN